ncbi:MAG: hypothetical protein ACE5IP_06405 [Terriglobia bacterium]
MPDYIFMLESRLSPEQLMVLNRVQQEAQELSLNIYLVGGAVRDLMTGSPIRDLDFAVEGNPARIVRRLEREGVHRLVADQALHSTELVLANGVSLSVEMAHSEVFQAPGRTPRTQSASILEDLRRRDFSANAMGVSLTPGSRGLLLDPTNGLADIENRELRILHNYSFLHDPLRMLRLLRFAARLGFRPEARTQEMFERALERGYPDYLQPRSLGREMEQITKEENAVGVLKALADHGLLAAFHRMLQKRKPDYRGLAKYQKYRLQALEAGYRFDPFTAGLHYVVRRLRGRALRQLLRNLGVKKAQVQRVLGLEDEARRMVKLIARRKLNPRQVYPLLEPIPIELLIFVLAEYSDKKKVQAKVYNYLFKYRPLRNKLPVRELQLMGVPTGPKFDEILERYFEALLDRRLRSRPQQLRFLRQLAGLPKPKPTPKEKRRKKEPGKVPKPAGEAAAKAEKTPAKPAAATVQPAARLRRKPAGGKRQRKAAPVRRARARSRPQRRRKPARKKRRR